MPPPDEDVSMILDDVADPLSDYGSDLGEDAELELTAILQELETRPPSSQQTRNGAHYFARIPPLAAARHSSSVRGFGVLQTSETPAPVSIEYDAAEGLNNNNNNCKLPSPHDAAAALTDHQRAAPRARPRDDFSQSQRSPSVERASDVPDTRSPLERFRTAPKKPLSVTDLVSPAWCELQYWYSLTKHGRKKRTPAMKQGSAVHKVLEEQVYTSVPVDVQTREDTWGLKIWNIIQGLRTLRTTGMTRELEMWGVLDGQIVNGVCDELSYTCTDPELEARLQKADEKDLPPANQSTISDFFGGGPTGSAPQKTHAQKADRQVYITDVKTRVSATVPNGPSLRPTMVQLMIYRKLLADLADGSVNASVIFERFKLKPDDHFSDSFISQLAGLELNLREDSTEDTYAPVESIEDAVDELLAHNSLNQLWQLMVREFQRTFTHGVGSISRVLRAEFRSQKDGGVLGARAFAYDDQALRSYLADEMKWWRGEREAQGVDVAEAFKCRSCEFAESCSWRIAKFDEATRNSRARTAAGRKSAAG